MQSTRHFRAALLILLTSTVANGDLVFSFTPTGTGGVSVTGTGSGMVTGGRDTNDWDIENFATDFLNGTFGNTQTSADTVSGTLTNITTGLSVAITNFAVDQDASSGDDIEFDTSTNLAFSSMDEFTFSLNATFDFGTLPFTAVITGTHTDAGGPGDEIFGSTSITATPEPASCLLVALGGLFLPLRRRRSMG